MSTASRLVVVIGAMAALLVACGDDKDGDSAAMEKTIRAVAAAENAGDQKAAAALMTDAGIAAFYDGTTRADLEAGKAEGFGEDPPTIQKVTAVKDDADSGTLTIDVTLGSGYALQTVQIAMVKQSGAWLADGITFGGGKAIAGRPLAKVDAVDYGYVVDGDLTSGQASIQFTNTGKEPHELLLVQIPQGIETDAAKDAILKSDPNKLPDGYKQIDFLAYAEPGSPSSVVNFAKALPSGHYAFVCFVPVGGGQDGPPHLSQGMIHDFTVS